ncbi:uncharacterized protein LOC125864017 [Solanum stenotomum]|uniref:uncharacterized protein LOC125864017 n=1 Tax=Solanum stenotomum TaxID=172797 RepID=UPI0020D09483|nr:uncharacterized protein LOC125864017 [Solanum stenotomum]
MAAKLRFDCINKMAGYEACIIGLKMAIDMNIHELLMLCKRFRKIEFRHTSRTKYELADALATITSMIKHPDTSYIDPVDIKVKEKSIHCSHVEAEPDGLPWYFDIKK